MSYHYYFKKENKSIEKQAVQKDFPWDQKIVVIIDWWSSIRGSLV
jgi:hypothetical protein